MTLEQYNTVAQLPTPKIPADCPSGTTFIQPKCKQAADCPAYCGDTAAAAVVSPTNNRALRKAAMYGLLGTVVGVPAYSIYKIGSLSDKIPNERKYIAVGIVGGILLGARGIAFWSERSKKDQDIGRIGASVLAATASYSVARGLFKQNPKTSLVLGGLVGLGLFAYNYNKSKQPAINLKQASDIYINQEDSQPIQSVPLK